MDCYKIKEDNMKLLWKTGWKTENRPLVFAQFAMVGKTYGLLLRNTERIVYIMKKTIIIFAIFLIIILLLFVGVFIKNKKQYSKDKDYLFSAIEEGDGTNTGDGSLSCCVMFAQSGYVTKNSKNNKWSSSLECYGYPCSKQVHF